jgi:hypothetical protein
MAPQPTTRFIEAFVGRGKSGPRFRASCVWWQAVLKELLRARLDVEFDFLIELGVPPLPPRQVQTKHAANAAANMPLS